MGRKPGGYTYYPSTQAGMYYAIAADHSYFWMSHRRKWVKSWTDTDQAIREEIHHACVNPMEGLPYDVLPVTEENIRGT